MSVGDWVRQAIPIAELEAFPIGIERFVRDSSSKLSEAFPDHVKRISASSARNSSRVNHRTSAASLAAAISPQPAAQKINQNVVILHALFGIAQNPS